MMRYSKILKHCALFLIFMLMAIHAAAQSFTVQVPRQVRQGETFQVRYVLSNANGSSLNVPPINGLKLLNGPEISQSRSVQIINGHMSESSQMVFTMLYRAVATGRFTVPPASISAGGKTLTTRPATIEVVASNQPIQNQQMQPDPMPMPPTPAPGTPSNADPMTQSLGKKITKDDFFVRISMSKDQVYEQEAVVCTIKLYSTYQISRFMCTLQPSFNGFLIEELKSPTLHEQKETLNGKTYWTAELKRCILYPQESGKLTITSGNYDAQLIQFDTFHTPIGSISEPHPVDIKIQSNSASVNILPLPEPKPAGFSGAVGVFKISSGVKQNVLKTFAPANYVVTVTGTGNLKYIKAPQITFSKDCDTYDPKTTVNLSPDGGDMSGSVDFDYTFIPQQPNTISIKGEEFVFFNTSTHEYETIKLPELQKAVQKGEGKPSSHYQLRNRDIEPLHGGNFTLDNGKRRDNVVSTIYWLFYLLSLIAAIASVAAWRSHIKRRGDNPRVRRQRAARVAAKRLKQSKEYLASGNQTAFYSEALTATWGYLSDKLNIPASQLNRDNIANEMLGYGFSNSHVDEVTALLDSLEEAQYAPSPRPGGMEGDLERCSMLMATLESVKRTTNEK